jgi:ribosomal protein S18 acetylase RimI-like enzyme
MGAWLDKVCRYRLGERTWLFRVCEAGKEVGSVQLRRLRECRRLAVLFGLYVEPDYRRRGLGSALVAAAQRYGLEQEMYFFLATVKRENEPSRRLLRKLGWQKSLEREGLVLYVKALQL